MRSPRAAVIRKAVAIAVLVLGLAAGAAFASTSSAGQSKTLNNPSSPGSLRLIEDGEWLVYHEYIEHTQAVVTLTSETPITIEKVPRGYRLTMRWTETNHSQLDVTVDTRVPTATGPSG